jgi:hypothetical protein
MLLALALGGIVLLLLQIVPRLGKRDHIQGCVRGLTVISHPNEHGVKDKYFRVAGHAFHVNTSPMIGGYHDDGDLIAEGASLRVDLAGSNVVNVDRLGTDLCRTGRAVASP